MSPVRFHVALLVILSLAAAEPARGADAGGRVFRDQNGNGVPDPQEEGLGGATVEVYGTLDAGGTLDRTFVTATDGTFAIAPSDIEEGCFVVRVTPPLGFRLAQARRDCPGAALGEPVGTRRYASPRGLIDALRNNSLRHIALGDSIAEPASGCTLSIPRNNAADYVSWFHDRLTCIAPGVVTENHAIGGKRATHLLLPAGTCGPPNLPHPTFADRCDNIFDAIAQDPDLVTMSIGGNDFLGTEPANQTEPFDPVEIQVAVDSLAHTRANLQEILSTLASELPTADVILNTVYDPGAGSCSSTDFHNIWVPLWDQVLRDVTWAHGDRFTVAEVYPEYAHEDVNGQTCCGQSGRICFDGIHPTAAGARIHLEKVWDAAGGLNLGMRDGIQATSNPDILLAAEELVATRFPSLVEDRTTGTQSPMAALARDDTGALVPAGDGELILRGFDATPDGIVPTHVVVVVRYRTDAAPDPDPDGDPYYFEASMDGFSSRQSTVTGWNTVTPIVGAGPNAPTVNAIPHVPRWREVRATLSKNLIDDGRTTGQYVFPAIDWADVAALEVRFRGVTRNGVDPYRLDWDAAWIEVYGHRVRAPNVYRAVLPQGLVAPANQIAPMVSPPFDDAAPPMVPRLFYAVDDGAAAPSTVFLVKQAAGAVRISW